MDRRMDTAVERALADRMRFALDIAEKSAHLVLRYFRTDDLSVDRKADASPVTIADREAERFLRDQIGLVFPDDAVLGEEHGETEGGVFRWILDPIDGTESFIRGVPLFGTLIGLEWNGIAVGGILGLPALAETIYAWRGHGAWQVREGRRPRPARVSAVPSPDQALLCMTSPSAFHQSGIAGTFDRLARGFGKTRGWGDCYAYALVATGRADAAIDHRMHIWDSAPLLPILEEAGGRFTDWTGVATIDGGDALATNGRIHDEVLSWLDSPPQAS
ncbi:MAG: inositol monophosphatase family protein [Candidatus Eisenbacteria bacterium]